ncbi:hypothetical protein [Mesorhizobium sp.]|uniref:hypothetical protein n=1 Tax=Mesorhizobium sp. TaxID=1871066 RepID=UPI001206C2F0|nr:hypothetical protein [Mesorhizobium sp.]TIL29359.1 MAG: hypothetical protein E5Y85_28540 [Mesorhizobium sp.]
MMTPDDLFFLEACRSVGKRKADADKKADIDLTPEAIDEVAATIVYTISSGAVFPPDLAMRLRKAARDGYLESITGKIIGGLN